MYQLKSCAKAQSFDSRAGTTKKILEEIRNAGGDGITDRHVQLGIIAATFHDVVQKFDMQKDFAGNIARVRRAGANEEASAVEAVQFMLAMNQRSGNVLFSTQDMKLVTQAIMATVPGFDLHNKTVIQPNLDKNGTSHPVVRALALADIGTAGIEGKKFKEEGDPLFTEANLDIAYAIQGIDLQSALEAGEDIDGKLKEGDLDFFKIQHPLDLKSDRTRQEAYRQRMLQWSKSQASFAQGRENLISKETAGLSPRGQEAVRRLFSGFHEAKNAVIEVVAEREAMDFWTLAKTMGFKIEK